MRLKRIIILLQIRQFFEEETSIRPIFQAWNNATINVGCLQPGFQMEAITTVLQEQKPHNFGQVLEYFQPTLIQQTHKEDCHLTFIFEILSKEHIIVVPRQQNDLRLHGVFNSQNGQKFDHLKFRDKYGWRCAQQIDMKVEKLEDVLKVAENLSPLKQEGFILRDKDNKRLKVKSKAYLRANWMAALNLTISRVPENTFWSNLCLAIDMSNFAILSELKPMIEELLPKTKILNKQCTKVFENKNMNKDMNKRQISFHIMDLQEVYRPFVFALCQNFERWHKQLQFFMPPKKISACLDKIVINQSQKRNKFYIPVLSCTNQENYHFAEVN